MSVCGTEQFGVMAQKPVCLSAGIPIKKRRFPLTQPSSPSQGPSSGLDEIHSVQNKCSGQGQDLSLSNSATAANNCENSKASDKFVSDVKREKNSQDISDVLQNSFPIVLEENSVEPNVNSNQSKDNFSVPTSEERKTANESVSMEAVGIKEKLMLFHNPASQSISSHTEFHVAQNGAPAVNVGKEIFREHMEKGCTFEFSTSTGRVEENCQMPENVNNSSLILSLGKGEASKHCKNTKAMSSKVDSIYHASRSNWDLNTTMDAWEGSCGDDAHQNTLGFNQTSDKHDVKPFMGSTDVVGASWDAGKRLFGSDEQRSNFNITSVPLSDLCKSRKALCLSHSTPSCPSYSSAKHSSYMDVKNSGRVINSDTIEMHFSIGNIGSATLRNVKLEPFDENAQIDNAKGRGKPVELLDVRAIEQELSGKDSTETTKLTNISPQKLLEHSSIKSELVCGNNQGTQGQVRGTSLHHIKKVVPSQDNHSSSLPKPSLTTKSESSFSGDVPCQSEYSTCNEDVNINMSKFQDNYRSFYQVCSELVSKTVGLKGEGSNASDGKIDISKVSDSNAHDTGNYKLKAVDNLPLESHGIGDCSSSDNEKINISAEMLEEDSYGSDFDSEGRQCGSEDYEYEDGEVRGPLADMAVDVVHEEREAKNVDLFDGKTLVPILSSECNIVHSQTGGGHTNLEYNGETGEVHIKECVDCVIDDKADQIIDDCLEVSSVVTVAAADDASVGHIGHRKPLDPSGKRDAEQTMDLVSSSKRITNPTNLLTVGHVAGDGGRVTETTVKTESTVQETACINVNNFGKVLNSDTNSSLIVNLPRASNQTSSSKTKSSHGRRLLSRHGRERYTDFGGGKFHTRGNRDIVHTDGPRKFLRETINDQPFRKSRLNFPRRRISSHSDSQHREWDPDREFAPDLHGSPADYCFSRHKRASAVTDIDLDCNNYVLDADGVILGAGRIARNSFNDDMASFHSQSSRRTSPGCRDGTATRSLHIHRVSRNISQSRSNVEDSELVDLGHSDKFVRGLQDAGNKSVFARPQSQYKGLDSQFVRGNRNFSSLGRKGVPQVHSKSPVRSRTQSPGPWSSPCRRSPDFYSGHPELTRQRSPALYRKQRMTSPDLTSFPREMLARRHDSPPYINRASDTLRDMESGQSHCHPRSVMPSRRNLLDRVLIRKSTRFDISDPRERTDGVEYFGGTMCPGRFRKFGCDRGSDERRKYDERQGIVRSFRPVYDGTDDGYFRFDLENEPRSFRFCPETDPDLVERSSFREREFDRRSKMGRVRSINEQEGNYRQHRQIWHDDGFDDVSRYKRRRY